MKTFLL